MVGNVIVVISLSDRYDYCRLFISGGGGPAELSSRLLSTGRYTGDKLLLSRDGVWIAIRRNKDATVAEMTGFLRWPVTAEIDRDSEVNDETMVAVVSDLVLDLRELGARVVVAAEFEDEVTSDWPKGGFPSLLL
jgi:hypothetical protein